MSNQIPGILENSRDPNCVAARAICLIDSLLPTRARSQPPVGDSGQVRWVLNHSTLEPKMRAMGKNKRSGLDVIEFGQIGIEHDAFAADYVDLRGDAFDRNDALLPGHSVTVAKRGVAVKGALSPCSLLSLLGLVPPVPEADRRSSGARDRGGLGTRRSLLRQPGLRNQERCGHPTQLE